MTFSLFYGSMSADCNRVEVVFKPPPPTVVRLCRKDGRVVQGCDLYIGREENRGGWSFIRSKWANPFSVQAAGSRKKAVAMYREYVMQCPFLLDSLEELSGLVLGCWCAPELCHGHVLIQLFNEIVLGEP